MSDDKPATLPDDDRTQNPGEPAEEPADVIQAISEFVEDLVEEPLDRGPDADRE